MASLSRKKNTSQLRIISGNFRGQKIIFPTTAALRPTPDSVRETLFNWLAPYLEDAKCLDMFAGSGILGFEALSRGAGYVHFVEKNIKAVSFIRQQIESMNIVGSKVSHGDINSWSRRHTGPFDIAFIDPPYSWAQTEGGHRLNHCLARLEKFDVLNPGAFIYLETPKHGSHVTIPENWALYREKFCGQVCFQLYTKEQ